MKISPLFTALALSLACAGALAGDGGSAPSTGSPLITEGSAEVLGGTVSVLAASGELVIDSIKDVGGASVVVIKSVSGAAQVSLRVSAQSVAGASLVAGAGVSLVVISTGYLLVAAGKAIAFIPNEIGKQLIHQSRVDKAGK